MTPLSAQLANLSVRAKKVEDDFSAAQIEAKDKLQARRDRVHAKIDADGQKLKNKLQAAKADASSHAATLKNKIDSDLANLKQKVAERKEQGDAKRAANRADLYEADAADAIDYALWAIDQADAAVLDALAARAEANAKR